MRTKKIIVKDIPNQEEANKIMNTEKLSIRSKMSYVSSLTGLCWTCRDRPAVKMVLFKIKGAWIIQRYCLEHFHYSDYETKKKKKRNKK